MLRHRLRDARRAFTRDRVKTASRRMRDFIRRVTQRTNKGITPDQSVALRADATAILDVMALRLGSAPVGLILVTATINAIDAQVATAGLDPHTTSQLRAGSVARSRTWRRARRSRCAATCVRSSTTSISSVTGVALAPPSRPT